MMKVYQKHNKLGYMNNELTREQLLSIGADPIISYYLKSLDTTNPAQQDDAKLPANFVENLRDACSVFNIHQQDFALWRLYRRLLLYYCTLEYKSITDSSAIMNCYSEAEIVSAFENVDATIISWHQHLQDKLLHLLFKEAFLAIMLEWARRYTYLKGELKPELCEQNAKEVILMLYWDMKYLKMWRSDLEHLLAGADLTQDAECYKSLTAADLCKRRIACDIQSRQSLLVQKFVLSSLQLDTEALASKYERPQSAGKEGATALTHKMPIWAQQSDGSAVDSGHVGEINGACESGCTHRQKQSKFELHSDFSDLNHMPLALRLDILRAANLTGNTCAVAKQFNIHPDQVSLVLRFRQEILNEWKYNPYPEKSLTHLQIDNLVAINELILEWYRRAMRLNPALTDAAIMAKAKELKKRLPLKEFKVTTCWLTKFKTLIKTMRRADSEPKASLDIANIVEDLKWILPTSGYALFKCCLLKTTSNDAKAEAGAQVAHTWTKNQLKAIIRRCIRRSEMKVEDECAEGCVTAVAAPTGIPNGKHKTRKITQKCHNETGADIVKQEVVEVDANRLSDASKQSVQTASESATQNAVTELDFNHYQMKVKELLIKLSEPSCTPTVKSVNCRKVVPVAKSKRPRRPFRQYIIQKRKKKTEATLIRPIRTYAKQKTLNECHDKTGDLVIKHEMIEIEDTKITQQYFCTATVLLEDDYLAELTLPAERNCEMMEAAAPGTGANALKETTDDDAERQMKFEYDEMGSDTKFKHTFVTDDSRNVEHDMNDLFHADSNCIDYASDSSGISLAADTASDDRHQIDLSKLFKIDHIQLHDASVEFFAVQENFKGHKGRHNTQPASKEKTRVFPEIRATETVSGTFSKTAERQIEIDDKQLLQLDYCAAGELLQQTTKTDNTSNLRLEGCQLPVGDSSSHHNQPLEFNTLMQCARDVTVQIKIEKTETESIVGVEQLCQIAGDNEIKMHIDISNVKLEETPVASSANPTQPLDATVVIRDAQDACEYLEKLERFASCAKDVDALALLKQLRQCFECDS